MEMYAKIESGEITEIFPSNNKSGTWKEISDYEIGVAYKYDAANDKIIIDSNPAEPPAATQEDLDKMDLELIRAERDGLLSGTDWTQVPDSPLTDSKKEEWKVYRQSLRDLPSSNPTMATVNWPTKPS